MLASSIRDHSWCQALQMHRLCVTPPETILGPGNWFPQLPSHSAPFYQFFKVPPDSVQSDPASVPSQAKCNLLVPILHSSRLSPLLLKTEQHVCRTSSPAGTTAKSAANEGASFHCTVCTSKGCLEDGVTGKLIPSG